MRGLDLFAGAVLALGLVSVAQARECQGAATGTRLILAIDGVRSDRGLMTATLYGGEKAKYLVRNGALKVWRDPARAPVTTMCIWAPGPGDYAVVIYQDLNSNLRFDHGMLGPEEPYGFSNNPRILFRPPPFEAVRFTAHAGDNTVRIHLHNP